MNCPSLWIRAGGQVRNRRWADATRRQFLSAILVAVEGWAMLPSTNSSLSDAFLDRRYNVVATSRSITKTGGFKASDKLELVDGSIADPSTATRIAEGN